MSSNDYKIAQNVSNVVRNSDLNTRMLIQAVEHNDIKLVKEIINNGHNPFIGDDAFNNFNYSSNAINIAIIFNKLEILKYILSYNKYLIKPYITNNNNYISFIHAIHYNNYYAQFEFLYYGFDINKTYNNFTINNKTIFMKYIADNKDTYLNAIQLMVIFGGDIQSAIDFEKDNGIYYNTEWYKWITKVKNWSRYRIGCTVLSPEQLIRITKSNHIKPDYNNETLQNVISSTNSQTMKEVIESHYKGWNPNIHHYYSNKLQNNIITILIIALRIDNLFEADNNNDDNEILESSNIMNLWLPSELWIYLLQFI